MPNSKAMLDNEVRLNGKAMLTAREKGEGTIMNVFEQIAELVQQGKLEQQCYLVGFTITQSGNFLVKYTNSPVVIVKTFTEAEQEFEKFIASVSMEK